MIGCSPGEKRMVNDYQGEVETHSPFTRLRSKPRAVLVGAGAAEEECAKERYVGYAIKVFTTYSEPAVIFLIQ